MYFDPICVDDGTLSNITWAIGKTQRISEAKSKKFYLLSDGIMFHLMETYPDKSDGELVAVIYPGGRTELKSWRFIKRLGGESGVVINNPRAE